LISFATIFLLMLLIFEIDKKFDASQLQLAKKHRIQFYLLTAFTLIVVYTGALVRHVNANLVCADWPFCSNSAPFAFGEYSFYQWVQMGHRLLAGILFIWTIILLVNLIKNYQNSRIVVWGWSIATALISMQVIFGAFIIFSKLNIWIALFHALFITLFFGLQSYFILLSYRSYAVKKPDTANEKKAFSFSQSGEIEGEL